MEKLVIIDGNNIAFRSFYALPPLQNFDGEISNAVFGFANTLVKIIEEQQPKYLAVAFDKGKNTFRHKKYSNYKKQRKPTPADLLSQLPILKKMLREMNICVLEKEEIEADDIIGVLSKKFKDLQTIIVSADKDVFQLVNSNTSILCPKKGLSASVLYTQDNFKKELGIEPYQIIELKALMGDASDNIPGVAGVGEKTAHALLEKHTTLDGVYENIENITGKLKDKLIADKENAYLSKDLATIVCDYPIDISKEELLFDYPFNSSVLQLFKQYQFNSLLRKTHLFKEIDPSVTLTEKSNTKKIEKVIIDKFDKLTEVVASLGKEKSLAIYLDANILSLATDKIEYSVSFENTLFEESLDFDKSIQEAKKLLEDKNIPKVLFDSKALRHSLYKYDISIKNVEFDVCIARYLINSNIKPTTNIKTVLDENLLDTKYCSSNLNLLKQIFSEKLKNNELERLYYDVELPLSEVLFDMEIQGIKIDNVELNNLEIKYKEQIESLTKEIHRVAGTVFNINSPKQLSDILFSKLGLTSRNNKKASTNVNILNDLLGQHEIIPLLLEYRQITKLYTTYVKAFIDLQNKETEKIHTLFNQTLTATGRLSSSEPNMQNIPSNSEEGRNLRKVFISSFENGVLISADYSQIELRLLANFSEDEKLIASFNNNEDIHTITASEIFDVPINMVTPSMRKNAKAINFGIIYGISDYGLSQNIGITRYNAAKYIEKYFQKYPTIENYMQKNVSFCKENGFVKTLMGRIRLVPEINNSNYNLRHFGERVAMNMPLQGSASDIIKLAMVKVFNKFQEEHLKSKMVLQVHDELIVDTHPEEQDIVTQILQKEMENVVQLKVKLLANISCGKNLFETN